MKYEVKHAMNDGDPCPYCGQTLYVDASGVFQCGGDGEGICSIWSAIYDFGRAAKSLPKFATIDVEAWIDEWVLGEVGQSWAEIGWDRDLHLRGVRETWNLPVSHALALGSSTIASGDQSHAFGGVAPDAQAKERQRLSERVGEMWGPQARAEHDAFLSSLEAAVAKKDNK